MVPLIPPMVTKNLAVVDWEPYKHAEIYKVTVRATLGTAEMQPAYPSQIDIWAAAGEADYVAVASQTGEPLLTSMSNFGTSSGTSEAGVYIRDTDVSVFELFQIQKRRAMLRKEY